MRRRPSWAGRRGAQGAWTDGLRETGEQSEVRSRTEQSRCAASPFIARTGGLTPSLRRAPVIHEALLIVESPDAHLACGLELERLLHARHQVEVDRKGLARDEGFIGRSEGTDEAEDQEVREERQLMTRSVVEAGGRAERGAEMELEFRRGDVLLFRRQDFDLQGLGALSRVVRRVQTVSIGRVFRLPQRSRPRTCSPVPLCAARLGTLSRATSATRPRLAPWRTPSAAR